MSDLGRALELIHGAAHSHRSVRATLLRRETIRRWPGPAREVADKAASAWLASFEGPSRYVHIELGSSLWIVRPDLVRFEREATYEGKPERAVIVGTADRRSHQAPGRGVRSEPDPLIRRDLPELHLFDPWGFVCDLELEVVGETLCADRPAIEAKATIRASHLADRCGLFPQFPVEDYLIEVDAERGVILKLTARTASGAIATLEVSELEFDEDLDPQLFVLNGQSEPFGFDAVPRPSSLRCSFCGKSERQVTKLIAGPGIYIPNECVDLCNQIIADESTV